MKKMKFDLIPLAVAFGLALSWLASGLVPGGPPPIVHADEDQVAHFMMRFDVDSTSVNYCRVTGSGGSAFGAPLQGPSLVATSGSSTTVTSSAGFGDLDADDIIIVQRTLTTGATDVRRVVGAPASTSSLTVDEAITLTGGFAWSYLKQTCGTAVTDGWIEATGAPGTVRSVQVDFLQGDIDGLEWRIEERRLGYEAPAVPIFPGSATACGAGSVASGYCRFAAATAAAGTGNYPVRDDVPWRSLRVGFKVQSTDTSDAGANLEKVYATLTVSRQK